MGKKIRQEVEKVLQEPQILEVEIQPLQKIQAELAGPCLGTGPIEVG